MGQPSKIVGKGQGKDQDKALYGPTALCLRAMPMLEQLWGRGTGLFP